MSDVITVADLEIAKKHDTFHTDVITGRTGDYATNAVTGQVQKTLPATIDGLDWSYVGKFADGVTFTKQSDFAIDADGVQWIYVGASPFPVVVPAGTVPSAPDYQVVHVGSLQALSGLTEPSDLDKTHRTEATLARLANGDYAAGSKLIFAELGGAEFDVLASPIPVNGYSVRDAGSGNRALMVKRSLVKVAEARTWYVDPILGTDEWGYGVSSGAGAYKTIQFAIDSLPDILSQFYPQTIELAAGTHDSSYISPALLARPAVVYMTKVTERRTAQKNSDLTGAVILKGQGKASTFIQTSTGYTYGLYSSGSEIAIQDISVKAGQTGVNALITAHRSGYVHARRVDVIGNGFAPAFGVVAEAGGVAELIDTNISGASQSLVSYPNSIIQIALTSVAETATVSGYLSVAVGAQITGAAIVALGGVLDCAGVSGTNSKLSGAVTVTGGELNGAYAEISGTVTARSSRIKLSGSFWSGTIAADASNIRLEGTKSFIPPATMSTVAAPITCTNGSNVSKDSTTEIRNSANILVSESYVRSLVSPNADGFSIPVTLTGEISVLTINAIGANRSNCTLGAIQGVLAGTEPPIGAILHIANNDSSYNTQIVDGTTAKFPTGSLTIGSLPGGYSGATLTWDGDIRRWTLVSVGVLN